MNPALRITVRCFSHVKSALGVETMEIRLPPGATTAAVEQHIRDLAPGKLADLPWRVALNHEFVKGEAALTDGDEVALIPPVQGG